MKFSTRYLRYAMFALTLLIALALSGWSLFTLAISLGIPKILAIVTSIAFDGSSIYMGLLANEYAKDDQASGTTRMWTYFLIILSAGFNAYHGFLLSPVASAFFAMPSIAAGALFSEGIKFENREALKIAQRLPERLSKIPKIAWLRFPQKAFKKQSQEIFTRYLEEPENATQHLVEESVRKVQEESINSLVQRFYTEGITTTDELFPLIQKAKSDEVTKSQVSKSLSYIKKKLGDSNNGYSRDSDS